LGTIGRPKNPGIIGNILGIIINATNAEYCSLYMQLASSFSMHEKMDVDKLDCWKQHETSVA
jgi:hypothetical protein